MSQSNRTSTRRGSGKGGTVTVIEARVHRNSARNARLAFVVTTIVVAFVGMVAFRQWLAPLLALIVGILTGLAAGAVVWCAVRIWPVVRVLWWWLPELCAFTGIVLLWDQLNRLPLTVVAVVMAVVAGSLLVPRIRRFVVAWAWCFIVRHRLRTCFAQFIVANQSGSLPLILIARPTPVGERVWIYLRPGLSPADLQSRLEKIAVACHASAVLIDRASARTAGLVQVDVKRREVLGALVGSPLTDPDSDADVPVSPAPAGIPTAPTGAGMDLSDVDTDTAVPAPAAMTPRPTPLASVPVKRVAAVVDSKGEDYSDWID